MVRIRIIPCDADGRAVRVEKQGDMEVREILELDRVPVMGEEVYHKDRNSLYEVRQVRHIPCVGFDSYASEIRAEILVVTRAASPW